MLGHEVTGAGAATAARRHRRRDPHRARRGSRSAPSCRTGDHLRLAATPTTTSARACPGPVVVRPTGGRLRRRAERHRRQRARYGATALVTRAGPVGEPSRAQARATTVVEGVGDHACEYMTGGAS
jgi:hypothetical protein